jgi:hypothetical protein
MTMSDFLDTLDTTGAGLFEVALHMMAFIMRSFFFVLVLVIVAQIVRSIAGDVCWHYRNMTAHGTDLESGSMGSSILTRNPQ